MQILSPAVQPQPLNTAFAREILGQLTLALPQLGPLKSVFRSSAKLSSESLHSPAKGAASLAEPSEMRFVSLIPKPSGQSSWKTALQQRVRCSGSGYLVPDLFKAT